MKKLFLFFLLGTAIAFTFSGCDTGFERDKYGSIISGGTIDVTFLRIGDCFNDLNPEEVKKLFEERGEGEALDVHYVSAVPCNMPHTNEVSAESESLFSDLSGFPSDEEFSIRIATFCVPEMYKYVGIDTNLSENEKQNVFLEIFPEWYQYFFPTKHSWNLGERKISCLLYTELARESSARNLLEKR